MTSGTIISDVTSKGPHLLVSVQIPYQMRWIKLHESFLQGLHIKITFALKEGPFPARPEPKDLVFIAWELPFCSRISWDNLAEICVF